MVFPGWLVFAGTELVNTTRAAAGARASGILVRDPCPALAASLADPPYSDPVTDQAPWLDTAIPASTGFYGLVGVKIDGAGTARTTRSWTELLGDGGVPGAVRRASPEIAVTVLALAADEEALSFGLGWLAAELHSGGEGGTVCVYAAAPTPRTDRCTGIPAVGWNPYAAGDALVRHLYEAVAIEGPQPAGAVARCADGVMQTWTWTMRAGVTGWWHAPKLVARNDTLLGPSDPLVWRDILPGFDPWGSYPDGTGWRDRCPRPVHVLDEDPYRAASLPAPVRTVPPTDAGNPNDPANWPQPGGHRYTAARSLLALDPGIVSDRLDLVPVISLGTGALSLRRLLIRWYDNPRDLSLRGDVVDPCLALEEVSIPWLPRGSELLLDGRIRRAAVSCPGGDELRPRRYGPLGRPAGWPEFSCGTPLIVEVSVDAASVAEDAWVEIHFAARQEAI